MKQIATRQNGNDLCPLFLSSKGPFAGYRTSLIRRVKSGRRRRRKLFHIHHQRAISWGPSKQNTTWNHVMFLTWTISHLQFCTCLNVSFAKVKLEIGDYSGITSCLMKIVSISIIIQKMSQWVQESIWPSI